MCGQVLQEKKAFCEKKVFRKKRLLHDDNEVFCDKPESQEACYYEKYPTEHKFNRA